MDATTNDYTGKVSPILLSTSGDTVELPLNVKVESHMAQLTFYRLLGADHQYVMDKKPFQ
jgi:hypothetical protein